MMAYNNIFKVKTRCSFKWSVKMTYFVNRKEGVEHSSCGGRRLALDRHGYEMKS
jgi:hypothetical protein